jgi:hypothetical protein
LALAVLFLLDVNGPERNTKEIAMSTRKPYSILSETDLVASKTGISHSLTVTVSGGKVTSISPSSSYNITNGDTVNWSFSGVTVGKLLEVKFAGSWVKLSKPGISGSGIAVDVLEEEDKECQTEFYSILYNGNPLPLDPAVGVPCLVIDKIGKPPGDGDGCDDDNKDSGHRHRRRHLAD